MLIPYISTTAKHLFRKKSLNCPQNTFSTCVTIKHYPFHYRNPLFLDRTEFYHRRCNVFSNNYHRPTLIRPRFPVMLTGYESRISQHMYDKVHHQVDIFQVLHSLFRILNISSEPLEKNFHYFSIFYQGLWTKFLTIK